MGLDVHFTERGKQSCAIYRAGRSRHRDDDTHRIHSPEGAMPRSAPESQSIPVRVVRCNESLLQLKVDAWLIARSVDGGWTVRRPPPRAVDFSQAPLPLPRSTDA